MVVVERRLRLSPAQSQFSSRDPRSRLDEPRIDVYRRSDAFLVETEVRLLIDFGGESKLEHLCEAAH